MLFETLIELNIYLETLKEQDPVDIKSESETDESWKKNVRSAFSPFNEFNSYLIVVRST